MKNNTFEKKGYQVIRNAVDSNLSNFLYKYLMTKREVANTLFKTKYISSFNTDWGYYEDTVNGQVPDTYSIYGDIAMDTLLETVKPLIEKQINTKLIQNYTYARIYKKGDILKRHKDRFSCELSTTLNLGGDKWSIYISTKESDGSFNKNGFYEPSKNKGFKVDLKVGDMLVYKGNTLEHWRERFKGENCGQVFLHYNKKSAKGAEQNKFDKRPHLGLPSWFRNRRI